MAIVEKKGIVEHHTIAKMVSLTLDKYRQAHVAFTLEPACE
jgi:hypothetical protein